MLLDHHQCNWIRNFLLVGSGSVTIFSDPDPKLGEKWDPDPDPKKIVTDPQHCWRPYMPQQLV
jgi:hypothetical protein